jgi:TetR/AcrR family transcriptional regulator
MARPRAATYDDQRSQILKAAADLFARRGYTAATLNEVASASGVSKATLYHYFSDKHALLEDIVCSHVARLQRIAAEAGAPPTESTGGSQGAAEARLRSLVRRFMQAYADAQSEHRVLTEDVKFLDERAREAVLDGQRQVVAAFAQGIAACRPDLRAELAEPAHFLHLPTPIGDDHHDLVRLGPVEYVIDRSPDPSRIRRAAACEARHDGQRLPA